MLLVEPNFSLITFLSYSYSIANRRKKENTLKESEQNTHTSTGSKPSIFTFFATFSACLLLLDNNAGLFTGSVFVFTGVFTTSVVIAMPFYFFKKKFLIFSHTASIIELLVTVFLTVMLFSYFFTDPLNYTTTASSHDSDAPHNVRCNEPIPEFTLGMNVILTKVQAEVICSCIWNELSPSGKNFSASLARDELHDASETQLRLFNHSFSAATKACNTRGL